VEEADMLRTVRATGAQIQTSVHKVTKDVLGLKYPQYQEPLKIMLFVV
jgi:hypothetical protein